jgi:hypothetical protein
MKTIFRSLIVIFLLAACSKESEKIKLDAVFFELNSDCFSTIKLQQADVIITNAADYQLFQDTIKRYFFPYCDTTNLPTIDFEQDFFAGKFTQTSGCSATFNRNVYFQPDNASYEFDIEMTGEGDCEMLISSFNCAIIPRQSDKEIELRFNVK